MEKSIDAVAALRAGMTVDEVQSAMRTAGVEGTRDWTKATFRFDDAGRLIEDELLRSCRVPPRRAAGLLLWVARLWAEYRIATVVETILTTPNGKLDHEHFNTTSIVTYLQSTGLEASANKSASNILRQMAQAGIYEPLTSGPSIVGVQRALPTSIVVPNVLRFVKERVGERLGITLAPGVDPIDVALALSINKWINLTPDEFRRAANPGPSPKSPPPRQNLSDDTVRLLHDELVRRGQVVLQGPPGVGKTFTAIKYVDWVSVNRRSESSVGTILRNLPTHERTPSRVAEVALEHSLTGVWDITQFHSSYGYEDFVRTLVPRPTINGVTFQAEHRRLSFMAALGVALQDLNSSCDVVLIVDEVNRADIARVFGELLYALEYRGQQVDTPYEVEGSSSLIIPGNLRLIGTMNTADRSIALIDYALRRRFTFIDLAPERAVIANAEWYNGKVKDAALGLFDHVQALFGRRGLDLATLAIGHSYFLPSRDAIDENQAFGAVARRFAYEVAPLLAEYAAEGLLEREDVTSLLETVGVAASTVRQNDVETQVAKWLMSTH